MTFYEFGMKELQSRGMFTTQAENVMKNVIAENTQMGLRWNDNISDYPPMMKNIIWMSIENEALNYIKISCPEAWFRPVFDKDHPLRKQFEETHGAL